jgi:hypothetical protein
MDEAVASKLRIEPDELSTIMLEMVEAVQTISSDMLRT